MYPPPAQSSVQYRLSEGAGLHAFALVVSGTPLPSYREWKKRHGLMPWAAKLPCEPGIVWRDDDHGLQALLIRTDGLLILLRSRGDVDFLRLGRLGDFVAECLALLRIHASREVF